MAAHYFVPSIFLIGFRIPVGHTVCYQIADGVDRAPSSSTEPFDVRGEVTDHKLVLDLVDGSLFPLGGFVRNRKEFVQDFPDLIILNGLIGRHMLPAKEYDAKQKDFLERFKEFYSGRMGFAIDHFIPVSAETSMLLNAYLKNSTGLSDEDDEKFFSALNRLRIRNPADIVQRKPDIIEYAGINALSMRLDKMILKGRKTEIIASAKEKYRKTMEFIRGAATEAFTAECKDFCTIVDESENYQRQLDSLNDFIREAQETQREIGALRMKLAEVLQKQSASTVKD